MPHIVEPLQQEPTTYHSIVQTWLLHARSSVAPSHDPPLQPLKLRTTLCATSIATLRCCFPHGGETVVVDVMVDADSAGYTQNSSSKNGDALKMGAATLKHGSTTQTAIALSSGDAKLSGIAKGASLGLGVQSMAAAIGIPVKLRIHSDSSAAIGTSRRR